MNAIKTLAALALAASLPVQARPSESLSVNFTKISYFQGSDRNWFNPANWSTGRVPGENDAVVLDGDDDVVIDPAYASRNGNLQITQLAMAGRARLEMKGSQLAVGPVLITDAAQLVTRSSVLETGPVYLAADGLNTTNPGVWYLKNGGRTWSAVVEGTMHIGLGGREPAALQKVGAGQLALTGYGHYANVVGGTIVLGGATATTARFRAAGRLMGIRSTTAATNFHRLFGDSNGDTKTTEQTRQVTIVQDMIEDAAAVAVRNFLTRPVNLPPPATASVDARIDRLPRLQLALYYDFKPAAGDTFQIVTADNLVGEFEGLREGALVGCTEDDSVGLWITYRGGDGNDVVLNAKPGDARVCATREHILLARQVGVPSL